MQQRQRVVPLCANIDAETQGMIFRNAKVIRSSLVHEGARAARSRIPGIHRKHVWIGLQLCRGSGPFSSPLGIIDVDRQAIPLDNASLPITQRLTTGIMPTILAV